MPWDVPDAPAVGVTEVTFVHPSPTENKRIAAYVRFVVNDCIVIHGAKLIRARNGQIRLFWPTRKHKGQHVSICNPIDEFTGHEIEHSILSTWIYHGRRRNRSKRSTTYDLRGDEPHAIN